MLAVPVLAGCVRAQLTMGISSDDKASGLLVLASPQGVKPPTVTVPDTLSSAVKIDPYQQGGFTGSQVTFTNLGFAQVQTLTSSLTSDGKGTYAIDLRRSGDIVTLDGTVDLTNAPPGSGAEVSVSISFPAQVSTTNGAKQEDNTITWSTNGDAKNMQLGRNNLLQATVGYADPSRRSFTQWTLLLGGATLGVALLVVLLALLTRDRSARPGRVRR
ncbi:MAG: DUF3153 domain-containing protein [Mycobacteriaceae bacterium]